MGNNFATTTFSDIEILKSIEDVIRKEAESLLNITKHIDVSYIQALKIIYERKGKVVLTGMGKSGLIARKISATMSSTGTTSVFMHPAEGAHGDLGTLNAEDIVIAISKSGESNELNNILPVMKRIGSKIISITENATSTLGKNSDVVLYGGVSEEACPYDLAPTSSTTVALAIGDALALALMKITGFEPADFAMYHPAGALGRRLLLGVRDVLIPINECATLKAENSTIRDVIVKLSRYGYGIVLFLNIEGKLDGILTDGDIRRLLEKHDSAFLELQVSDVMIINPLVVDIDTMAFDALKMMEDREKPLNVMPVIDNGQCAGIIRTHELVRLV